MNNMDKLVNLMPELKNYSIVLSMFILYLDPDLEGVHLKQWYIIEKTGLCQRSLQLAIKELESKELLTRIGDVGQKFILHL